MYIDAEAMGLGRIFVFAMRALQLYKGQKSISGQNFHSFMHYICICMYVCVYDICASKVSIVLVNGILNFVWQLRKIACSRKKQIKVMCGITHT